MNKIIYPKSCFINKDFANSVDPDKTAPKEQSYMDLHCLFTGMCVRILKIRTLDPGLIP